MRQQRYRILLVEDDQIDQLAFKKHVDANALPYDCDIADSIAQASQLLSANTYDAVIADYQLGDGTAFDILSLVENTPVLFATGAGDEETAVEAMKAGASDYLIKDHSRAYLKVLPITIQNTIDKHKAKSAVAEYERLKNELVMTIAHELRTPLCIFKGIISNALDNAFGRIRPKLREKLTIADQNIDRLSCIVTDIVDISLFDTNQVHLQKSEFCLEALAGEVVDSLRRKAESSGHDLRLITPHDETMIFADKKRIADAVRKIIENAIKFTDDGTITVAVLTDDNTVRLSISDNGPGIEPEAVKRIFDRFLQVRKMVGPGEHGTGLGLPIAKAVAQMHGGSIEVDSEPGKGSTFHLILPLTDTDQKPYPQKELHRMQIA